MDNTIVKNITSQGIDKTAIKNFAVYARNKLIKDIKNKAAMIGVTESGIQEPLSTSTGNIQLFDIGMQEPYRIEGKAIEQRNGFTRELKKRAEGSTYKTAYETLIEEVAYTWFNRIIAIRFMEVNNYMPDRMRILSSGVEGINEPEFITHVFETSFQFSEEEKNQIIELKTDGSNLAIDELFQHLFIKQCNSLNANLPELFEKTNDYTELLLTVSYNDIEGVIYKLVHDVPEANFDVNSEDGNGQVEIIGWLYQYYNSERKDEVINVLGGKAIKKEDIPAATQLFTTDWVVRYMVDNSLGKYWMERNPHSDLIHSLEYLVTKDIEEVDEKILPEDIKFLDNCMGSGHILVYAFDVLMKIYESEGYTTREAARLVVEKNLYGLEIDKRSYQLSYFAIMMKGRQHNRRILNEDIQNNLYVFRDSTSINQDHLQYLGKQLNNDERKQAMRQLNYLIDIFKNSEELGSIILVEGDLDTGLLLNFIEDFEGQGQISFETIGIEETQKQLRNLVKTAGLLKQKYEVVVTNPPYMNKLDKGLKKYVNDKYKGYTGDLFSVFIYRNAELLVKNGYSAYMSPFVWMFIKTYQKLREYIISTKNISSLVQMEYSAFEEATVPICSFVLKNSSQKPVGTYIKLSDFKGGMEVQRIKTLKAINNFTCNYKYEINQKEFNRIPGNPIAYWLSPSILGHFKNTKLLGEFVPLKTGLTTGDNYQFLRHWYEVDQNAMGRKWFPLNKGGNYRKWYGNNQYVINWEEEGKEIKQFKGSTIRNEKYYFKEGVTWSKISAGNLSARYSSSSHMFDAVGLTCFPEGDISLEYLLGFLCSKVANLYAQILNPTLSITVGTLSNIPFIFDKTMQDEIKELTTQNIAIAKRDWDSDETSWEFSQHPFIIYKDNYTMLQDINLKWNREKEYNYISMKNNEIKLNNIFIDMYGLCKDIDIEIDRKEITLRQTTTLEDIRNFLSYFVGVFFGRYSLEKDGLVSVGETIDDDVKSRENSVILISSEDIFSNDIATQFTEFVAKCYGRESLEENLKFIANILNPMGNEPIEVIRNYYLKEFYQNHLKKYQKRPIYWLYDSGKQNGFKALVYMHRYDEDTTGKVRVDYLHQVQRAYERTITTLQEDIANSKDAKETTQLQKQLEKITKQLKECRDYDERLGHMALERVAIDLDDGVKVNYQKVQTDSKGKFHQILAKIK